MDWLSTLIDHWRWLALPGVVATVRLLYRFAVSVSVATWERDQLREQVRILEANADRLEHMLDGRSGDASSAPSSGAPGATRTRTRRTRRSSSGSTG